MCNNTAKVDTIIDQSLILLYPYLFTFLTLAFLPFQASLLLPDLMSYLLVGLQIRLTLVISPAGQLSPTSGYFSLGQLSLRTPILLGFFISKSLARSVLSTLENLSFNTYVFIALIRHASFSSRAVGPSCSSHTPRQIVTEGGSANSVI